MFFPEQSWNTICEHLECEVALWYFECEQSKWNRSIEFYWSAATVWRRTVVDGFGSKGIRWFCAFECLLGFCKRVFARDTELDGRNRDFMIMYMLEYIYLNGDDDNNK